MRKCAVVMIQSYTEMGNLTLGKEQELCAVPHLHVDTIRLFLNQPTMLICNLMTYGYGNKFIQNCHSVPIALE